MRVLIVMAFGLLMIPGLLTATELERETLAPDDGWAAFGAGTTGGSLATDDQVYTVTNRREFIAALNDGVPSSTSPSNPSNVPKIIRLEGTIDFNVDDENQPLGCEDYFRPDPVTGELFSYEAFEAAFDPGGTWGRVNPSGPQERARAASAAAQQARVRIRPGSNTTIVGVGKDATLKGIWLDIRGTANVPDSRTNIIVRNLSFIDTYDCFPQWAPNDGALGAWNSLYDSISLRDSNNVWIDHNRFEDVETADATLPNRLRRAVPSARRPDRHHQRVRPRDRVVERVPQPRQSHADRLIGQRADRRREAARDPAPQSVRGARPARTSRALRPGPSLQQLLQDLRHTELRATA